MRPLYTTLLVILLGLGLHLQSSSQNINANLRQKFISSIGANNEDQLGSTIATDGEIAVIGAASDDQGGLDRGAVYILGKNVGGPNNWGLVKKVINGSGTNTSTQTFINTGSANGDRFGFSVSISGNVIAVGASFDIHGGVVRGGATYLLGKDVGGTDTWGLIKKIVNGPGTNTATLNFINVGNANFDFFGYSVYLSGNTLAVGARSDDQGGPDRGAVYVLGKDTGGTDNWGLVKKVINGSGTNTSDQTFVNVGSNDGDIFGVSVSLSANLLAVGASSDDQNGLGSTGAVYVLGKDTGGTDTWGLVKKIINGPGSNTANQTFINIGTNSFDFFGASVSLSGNTLAIGARFDDQGGPQRGAVYLVGKDTGGSDNWGLIKKIINGSGTNTANQIFINVGNNISDNFGVSVSLSGNMLASGAFTDDQGGLDRGAVYILGKDTGGTDNWGLVKKIINGPGSNTTDQNFINSGSNDEDNFGIVSLAGNTLAVGAFSDDQAGTNRGAGYMITLDPSDCSLNLTAAITPNTPQTVCSGGSLSLSGSSTGGTSPTYTWSSLPAGFSSTQQNPTFVAPTVATPTTYTVTLTVTEGSCTASASITVTVNGTGSLTLTEPITSGTVSYSAGQITATNQISNATVEYIATQSVVLNPGFSAIGNSFKAYIGGCN
ncbi:MAG: hypothetical protein U0X91_17550 [Spirosomataceae bacterium]